MLHVVSSIRLDFVLFINRYTFKIDYSFAESNDAYTHFNNLSDRSNGHFNAKVFRDQ